LLLAFTKETAERYVQEYALTILENQDFKDDLKSKAKKMSADIGKTLECVAELIREEDAELKDLRFQVVHQMYKFAAELNARTGVFTKVWVPQGTVFDPTLHRLDEADPLSQAMPLTVQKKQKILMTRMFGVKRKLPGHPISVYSKPIVILQKPYVDFDYEEPAPAPVKKRRSKN
jgi:hypothetical protein